ncbi:MAG: hypothetical protein HDQ93_06995 [Desulfovibrio sp.]|nr:hypothetical protein [Desulfovibrio sp.]
MSIIAFDTLAYSKRLQQGGIPQEQAEAMAQANAEAFAKIAEERELATRRDIESAKLALRKDIETTALALRKDIETVKLELKNDFQKEIANTKHELLKWTAGMIATQGAVIVAALSIVYSLLKQ